MSFLYICYATHLNVYIYWFSHIENVSTFSKWNKTFLYFRLFSEYVPLVLNSILLCISIYPKSMMLENGVGCLYFYAHRYCVKESFADEMKCIIEMGINVYIWNLIYPFKYKIHILFILLFILLSSCIYMII